MANLDPSNPLAYFRALHLSFSERIAKRRKDPNLAARLLKDCFSGFEAACGPPDRLACAGGCSACCGVRVVATAPEILLIAATIRNLPRKAAAVLGERIGACAAASARLGEQERMALQTPCPFVGAQDGLCVLYAVRPLACRGHASYDRQACADATPSGAERPPRLTPAHRHPAPPPSPRLATHQDRQ